MCLLSGRGRFEDGYIFQKSLKIRRWIWTTWNRTDRATTHLLFNLNTAAFSQTVRGQHNEKIKDLYLWSIHESIHLGLCSEMHCNDLGNCDANSFIINYNKKKVLFLFLSLYFIRWNFEWQKADYHFYIFVQLLFLTFWCHLIHVFRMFYLMSVVKM